MIRRALAILLLASSLKLLGVPDSLVAASALVALMFAFFGWRLVRDRIKRMPAGAVPTLPIPDLGAVAGTGEELVPERDTVLP